MLDRLTHRVHIIEANGQSYRLRQSKRRLASKHKHQTEENNGDDDGMSMPVVQQ